MPLKQCNILYRHFGFKVRSDSRLTTRLFSRGIKKPKAATRRRRRSRLARTTLPSSWQALIDEELNNTPPHSRVAACHTDSDTPVFEPDKHLCEHCSF